MHVSKEKYWLPMGRKAYITWGQRLQRTENIEKCLGFLLWKGQAEVLDPKHEMLQFGGLWTKLKWMSNLGVFQPLETSIYCLKGVCERLQNWYEGPFRWMRGCNWMIGIIRASRNGFTLGLQCGMVGFLCAFAARSCRRSCRVHISRAGVSQTTTLVRDWSWERSRPVPTEMPWSFNIARISKLVSSWWAPIRRV